MNREDYERLKQKAEDEYRAEVQRALGRRTERLKALETVWGLQNANEAGQSDLKAHERTCRSCGESKPVHEFGTTDTGADKRKCAACEAATPPDKPKKKIGRPPKPRGPDGKECTKCGSWKSYDSFSVNRSSSDGRSSHCKDCRNGLPPTHIDAPLPEHLQGKGHTKRYCSRGRLCLAYPDDEHPGEIPGGSPASVCSRCSRARAYG